jgi:hypothetical protein
MHTTHLPTVLTTVGASPSLTANGPNRQSPGRRPRAHWSARSLPTRLNAEWRELCADADAVATVGSWPRTQPALACVTALEQVPRRVSAADPGTRDEILLALLTLAQAEDQLAGRAVLQVMMPKAVRVAMGVLRRPDVAGDRDEAFATAVAALWQVIARYPIERRPKRVAANLAMDTLAVVQRGHTGSSHFARTFPERPCADLREVCEPAQRDVDIDDLSGPVDAELLMLLAWGVRTGVLQLEQARFLARAYGLDGLPAQSSAAVAAEYGLSAAALRQRCHRLARHLGRAAVEAGITPAGDCPDLLGAA